MLMSSHISWREDLDSRIYDCNLQKIIEGIDKNEKLYQMQEKEMRQTVFCSH